MRAWRSAMIRLRREGAKCEVIGASCALGMRSSRLLCLQK
jgi:hypothetical protein